MIFIVETFAQKDMKTKMQNKNINKYHYIKIENSFKAENDMIKFKRQPQQGRKQKRVKCHQQ